MSKLVLSLVILSLGIAPLFAQTIDTWVTSQGAMFEASVKNVVPGQVTFILKDGREQPVPMTNLSDRSRAKLIESLGLGTTLVAAAPTPTAPTPATPAATTTPAPMPTPTPVATPTAGTAIDASDITQINAQMGQNTTIVGTVSEVVTLGASGHKLLKFDGSTFNIFISKQILDRSTDWILDDLPGKRLQVTGKLESYRDTPQIKGTVATQLVRVQ